MIQRSLSFEVTLGVVDVFSFLRSIERKKMFGLFSLEFVTLKHRIRKTGRPEFEQRISHAKAIEKAHQASDEK